MADKASITRSIKTKRAPASPQSSMHKSGMHMGDWSMKYLVTVIIVVIGVWIVLALTKPEWVLVDGTTDDIDNAKMLLWVAVISVIILVILYILYRMNGNMMSW